MVSCYCFRSKRDNVFRSENSPQKNWRVGATCSRTTTVVLAINLVRPRFGAKLLGIRDGLFAVFVLVVVLAVLIVVAQGL